MNNLWGSLFPFRCIIDSFKHVQVQNEIVFDDATFLRIICVSLIKIYFCAYIVYFVYRLYLSYYRWARVPVYAGTELM